MARKPAAQEPAETVARLVYGETDLSENGQLMYDRWSQTAAELEEDAPDLWMQDWATVMRAFRRTENAMKNLNLTRLEDEDEPLTSDEDIEDFFQNSEDFTLDFAGDYQGFTVRVWNYSPWDGHLAFAVARGHDSVFAAPTDVS